MCKDFMHNLTIEFYQVCVFGKKDPTIEDAANRAYLDLCRTIWNTKEDSRNKAKNEVIELILSKTKELKISDNTCFDKFHETLCDEIIKIYKKNDIEFYYGQAQKWVNMTMKYLCVIGREKYPWLKHVYSFLHIPIDSVILNKTISEFKMNFVIVNRNKISLKNLSWSRIDKETYHIIQTNLRRAIDAKGEVPIFWEFTAWNNPENK